MTEREEVFIGIDGGASRSSAVVINEEDEKQWDATGGPLVAGPLAGAEIDALVTRVLETHSPDVPVRALCCGLAGAGRPVVRAQLERELRDLGLARWVRVVTDAEVAYHDAFGEGPGTLLIAGTGSVGWARTANGMTYRVGGWGPQLGDDGSGYTLGRQGLAAAVRAAERRGPATALLNEARRATGALVGEELAAWADAASRAAIARFAENVLYAAEEGDDVACNLRDEAVGHLVGHVRALRRRFKRDAPPLALAGGLINLRERGDPPGLLRQPLVRALQDAVPDVRIVETVVDAARGAARMAYAMEMR